MMLGYERDDLDNMVLAIDSALTTVNPDDDPWLHRNLTQASDFKTAGEALNWVLDRYPDEMLELTVTSLPAYEKEYA